MRSIEAQLFDVFSDLPFGGNVAGVVPAADGLSLHEMQGIAAELAAPTTGFVTSRDDGVIGLRFFTPAREIDLCGHVTLAVAAARVLDGGYATPHPIVFETAAGRRRVEVRCGPAVDCLTARLGQTVPGLRPAGVQLGRVAHALGLAGSAIATDLPLAIASTGLRHLVVGLEGVAELERSSGERPELEELSRELEVDTVAAFALLDDRRALLRCRDFCAAIGKTEESASGTTASGLAAYCWERGLLGESDGEVVVESEQGVEMGRPSEIRTYLKLKHGRIHGVEVEGVLRRSMRGTLFLR